MPNFHAATFQPLTYPCTQNQTTFSFEAFSKRGNRLVMATHQNEQMFVRIAQKEDGSFLIKGDKVTRPTQASFLQKVLMDFRDATCAEVRFSNIEPKKFVEVKRSPYLKDIEFFAHSFTATKEIWVEIGFGSGRHLLHQAKKILTFNL